MQTSIDTDMNQEKCPLEVLSWDDAFHLCSSRRRREMFRLLLDEPSWDLGDLGTAVAKRTYTPDEYTSGKRKTTYISLYQTHAPKLDDYGVVEFDAERGYLEAADGLKDVALVLAAAFEAPNGDFQKASELLTR